MSKIKIFRTSAICPRCKKNLLPSDIDEYKFVCLDCDENFYGIEVHDFSSDLFEVSISMTYVEYELFKPKLIEIADKYNCDFLGFDNLYYDNIGICDMGWNSTKGIPDNFMDFANEIESLELKHK